MKVGDLVRYTGPTNGVLGRGSQHIGVIIDMTAAHGERVHKSFYVWWVTLHRFGWWDDFRLKVVNEDR
jgi:hypothetical protein